MWIFTTSGFLSAVAHSTKPGMLLVRARIRADLEPVAAFADVPIVETRRADYRWRCEVPQAAFARYVASQAEAIDYPNFKNACHGDPARDRALMKVWQAMLELQHASG